MLDETRVRLLLDRMEIIDVVNRVATAADRHDWAAVRSCFTDELDLDYTSLNGGAVSRVAADALMEQWRGVLEGFQATQHIVTNHTITIDGDAATCVAYVHATHYLPDHGYTGDATWTLGGTYTYELARTVEGWKIAKDTLTATWATGNGQLPALAQRRAARAGSAHDAG